MTTMVVDDAEKAVLSEVLHERNIALLMLAHAMHQLHDTLWSGIGGDEHTRQREPIRGSRKRESLCVHCSNH